MSGLLANIYLKFLRVFFFTMNVSVFLQLAAIFLKIAGVSADHISFSQMVFFIFYSASNVLINERFPTECESYSVLYHLMADQRIAVIAPTARQAGRPRSITIPDCLI